MFHLRTHKRAGFSIREATIVILLMIVVIAIALPVIDKSRREAAKTKTMDNLSVCARAVHSAHDQHKKYPPYFGPYGGITTPLTFHAHLLPFVGERQLYDKLVATAVVPAYLSPMDPTRTEGGAGAANFPVNIRLYYTQGGMGVLTEGANLIYPRMPQTFQQDGTSETALFATKYQHCGPDSGSIWMDPGNNSPNSIGAATFGRSMEIWQKSPKQSACNPSSGTAVSFTAEGIQVAFCDASVRFFTPNVRLGFWQAIHTPNAGYPAGDPYKNSPPSPPDFYWDK